MISNIQISGNLPSINLDRTEQFKQIKELLIASVKMNFQQGGRPTPWQPLKPNIFGREQAFNPPGALYQSIDGDSGSNFAEVTAGEGLPYAAVQNFGTSILPDGMLHIPITEKSRGFFWVMWYNTGDERWKWMAITHKDHFDVFIPARQFMMFQQEDIQQCIEILASGIFIFSGTDSSNKVEL